MQYFPRSGFEFRDRENLEVDFLCEVYAVTGSQLNRYMELNSYISSDEQIAQIVDATADFMVISQTGKSKPKIHDVGRLFRDETFKMEGVAVHKNQTFDEHVGKVFSILKDLEFVERG